MKVLSNYKYTIRKLGTRYTWTLQRIRLRIYKPDQCLPDVTVKQTDYLPDAEELVQHKEWYVKAWESNFEDQNKNTTPTEQITKSTPHVQEINPTDTNCEADEDTTSTPDFSNLTTDARDNPFITNRPPIEDLDYQNESSPISIGYNPRNVAE